MDKDTPLPVIIRSNIDFILQESDNIKTSEKARKKDIKTPLRKSMFDWRE